MILKKFRKQKEKITNCVSKPKDARKDESMVKSSNTN